MTSRRLTSAIITCILAGFAITAPTALRAQTAPSTPATSLPPGFAIMQLTAGLSFPVDMAFMPSGDILVAEKGQGDADGWAAIRLVRNGTLQAEPVLTLSATVINDSGIFGLTIDPAFSTNGHVYVWYATGSQAPDAPDKPVNRLARFTFDDATGQAVPGSYTVILDNIPHSEWHNGGGLIFDGDGTLFLSTGDAERDEVAQDLSTYNGKLLRIQPTADGYTVPSDNPFIDVSGALPEIYAVGLRNPFRMTRNAATGELYIGDVGNKTWEELNRVAPGANYGWSEREGPCPSGQRQPCKAADGAFTDPVLYYAHSQTNNSGGAITGIAFYTGDAFPPEYQGKLFFADFDQRYLAVGAIDAAGFGITEFFDGVDRVVDMEYFRNNLYFLDLRQGAVYMLYYTGSANVAPVARMTVDVDAGAAPLTVTFSAAESYDPDDTVLTYIWTPGDGTPEVRTQTPGFSHAYTQDGTYTAILRVEDVRGAQSAPVQLPVTVYSGVWPTIQLTNLADATRTRFHGGDDIQFAAVRAADADDLDREAPFTWLVELLHNDHAHPELVDFAAITGTLSIPVANHGGDADIAYRFTLTMHTADGQPVAVEQTLEPAIIRFAVQSNPPGTGLLTVDNEVHAFPYSFAAIVGTQYELTAPPTILTADDVWQFTQWQPLTGTVPLTSTPRITVTIPLTDGTVTAGYEYARPAEKSHLPLISEGGEP
jgi:glucose/arabinose dehydrogenase